MTNNKPLIASLATALAFFSTSRAEAFNFSSHAALSKAAAQLLAQAEPKPVACTNPTVTPLPSGPEWEQFLGEAKQAYDRLILLRSGLAPIEADVTRCPNYDKQDNLSKLGNIQVTDLQYLADRDYEDSCNLKKVDKGDPRVLASVLGWHAGMADNRIEDTAVWIKPLNAQHWGAYKDAASNGWAIVAGVALAPIACFVSLFTDGDCGDGFDWARKYNPVDYAAYIVPGVPGSSFRSEEFNGIWHHMEVSATGPISAMFNDPPGIYYLTAGPSDIPGVLDAGIFALGLATGLTVDYSRSLGPKDFGQFDDVSRNIVHWEAHHIGTTEFCPVDNLGQYGWKRYMNGGNAISADGLGWALHALGDVAFPHHIAATTAWGHRPLEDAIGELDFEILKLDEQGQFQDCEFRNWLWTSAFDWWRATRDDFSLERMLHQIGQESWDWTIGHEDVWSDSASDQYYLGEAGKKASIESYKEEKDFDPFGMTLTEFVRPMASDAVGGMVAMLMHASKSVNGDAAHDPTAICPDGTQYRSGQGCVANPTPIPPLSKHGPIGGMRGECAHAGGLCHSNQECCDKQVCEDGECMWLESACGPGTPNTDCSCKTDGNRCRHGHDCCNGHDCVSGRCANKQTCGAAGAQCQADSDCCQTSPQLCTNGVCSAAPTQCTIDLNCGANPGQTPCCSGYTCVVHMARCTPCSPDPTNAYYCDACGPGKPAFYPTSSCP